MLQNLLLVLIMLVCLALIGVVLLQRSEGGAFGGGSPTGLVTARGAGDLLTRTTWVLFGLFLALSLSLTILGGRARSSQAFLNGLKNVSVNPAQLIHPATPTPAAPTPAPGAHPRPAVHKASQIVTAPVAPASPPLINAPASLALPPVGGAQTPPKS